MPKHTELAETWPDPIAADARNSVLAADLVIDGDVGSKAPVELHGKVNGLLRAPEILVAPPGIVEGTVIALDLSVQGSISGTISARQVSFASSAVVRADITHERIAIESGAQIEGRLQRKLRSV